MNNMNSSYNRKTRQIKKHTTGEWVDMPPDDGFDEAFFMFLDYESSFVDICYSCSVHPAIFIEKLNEVGYFPKETQIANSTRGIGLEKAILFIKQQ